MTAQKRDDTEVKQTDYKIALLLKESKRSATLLALESDVRLISTAGRNAAWLSVTARDVTCLISQRALLVAILRVQST